MGCPVVLLIVDENPEVLLESLIRSLRLAVGFGVVGGREVRGDVERLTERLPEVRDEEVASVGDDVGRETVLREYVPNELAGELRGRVGRVGGDEDPLLGESAYDYEDRVEAVGIG